MSSWQISQHCTVMYNHDNVQHGVELLCCGVCPIIPYHKKVIIS